MIKAIKQLFFQSKAMSVQPDVAGGSQASVSRHGRPDWEIVLTGSLEQNCMAPTDEVILQSFDLYRLELYEPLMTREHRMAEQRAEIIADFAALKALVPEMIERALAVNHFEFSNHTKQKEVR